MRRNILTFLLLLTSITYGQEQELRIEPPHWWVGFNNAKLQLLVHADKVGSSTPRIAYEGIRIKQVHKADSPNYLFLDLEVDSKTVPGHFDIFFTYPNGHQQVAVYELKSRERDSETYKGFDASDVIYLITPDRFANGNPNNDKIKGLQDQSLDRSDGYARHGGDLRGMINHLDYIADMGFTSLWPTPLLVNDMTSASYHGYAITDYYKVDPRFGTLEEYIELSRKAKAKGLGLIMDQVANHCGLGHWWMEDLPFKDWINHQEKFLSNSIDWKNRAPENIYSNHRRTTNQDLYASSSDKKGMTEGWFVSSMPDLNQRNPFLGNYIIQNSLWWIETLGLSGIRQDTYPYPDKHFMQQWASAIMDEYPNFSIVGEEWSYNPLLIGYWQTGANNVDGYDSMLTSSMDFAMQDAIVKGITENESWGTGLVKIYEGLANDFHYPNPKMLMLFPDNHDMDRIHTQTKEDMTHTKMVLGYMLALPRILQLYYGTEVLLQNSSKPGDHGLIRSDFPGGWKTDESSAFTAEGLSENQLEMQGFLKQILNFRKNNPIFHEGETVHFAPQDGVYVFVRKLKNRKLIVILNKNLQPYELNLERFKELNLHGQDMTNILNAQTFKWEKSLQLPKQGVYWFTN